MGDDNIPKTTSGVNTNTVAEGNATSNSMSKSKPSLYDLAPNDMPGLLITQTQLRSENFDEWSRAVKTALRAKKKVPFIDGSISRPSEDSDNFDDWLSVNSMIVSWIMNTIEAKIRSTITYRESARDLWIDIQERFNVSNGPRIQQLKTELHTCKQINGMSISDYYAKLKKIWEALSDIDPVPACECGRCTCKLGVKLEKREEDAKIHQFLMGVNDEMYETVRSNLLVADDLGNINKTYSSLVREERLRMGAKTMNEKPEVMGLSVQANDNSIRSKPKLEAKESSSSRYCTHCKRSGHESSSCFFLHGYPEWWLERHNNTGQGRGSGRGSGRGRGGQQYSNTGQGRGSAPRVNTVANVESSETQRPLVDIDKASLLGITSEQWRALESLLHNKSSSSHMSGKRSNDGWIIDTGASNHMTGDISLLDNISEVHSRIGLPDTPIEQNHRLVMSSSPLLTDPLPYRRLVGKLIYLAVTRPDLAYVVHTLAQFMQEPCTDHWEAALRVVRYLKGHPGQGILLRTDSDLCLHAWCVSDWAGCPKTRRSLTGWFITLGLSPISWKTKKQHTVSRSSAEAEYRSMSTTTSELKWLKSLLSSLGVIHTTPISLHCDSQAALHIAANPVFHERTKHIEIDCHFVRDAIIDGLIRPSFVKTHIQLADIFTKALGRSQFSTLLGKLGIRDLHAPT